jgi:hypothetical protein
MDTNSNSWKIHLCLSYLGTILSGKNMVTEEINRRIMAGSKALQDLD